jgi:hypothetical protein
MFDVNAFIVQGHQKVIDHYRWLQKYAVSETERQQFQTCADQEQEALNRFIEQGSISARRAA